MAQPSAIRAVQAIYEHVDNHVRELLPTLPSPEVDSALLLLAGESVIETGVAGCWSFDFQARITGWYLQEFIGTTGSIVVALEKAQRGPSPSFTSIVGSSPPTISSGRYGENSALAGWDTAIARGDLIRVSVTSASAFSRILLGLRIRRLEPV